MRVKERLETAYRLLGFDHLSEFAAAVGVKPGTAQQQANRGKIPYETAKKYVDRGRSIGLTLDWLQEGKGAPPHESHEPVSPISDRAAQFDAGAQPSPLSQRGHGTFSGDARGPIPVPRDGDPDLKIYRLVAISGGIAVLSIEPVDLALRPEEVKNVPDAFGVHVASGEMEPAYGIGDYLCISPVPPPAPGKDVLLMSGKVGDPNVRTALRRLVSITDTHWACEQFTPPKKERFAKADWPHALRVVLRRIS